MLNYIILKIQDLTFDIVTFSPNQRHVFTLPVWYDPWFDTMVCVFSR